MVYETIIEEMTDYIKRHTLNQTQFAQLMNVSCSSVSLWLNYKRKPNTKNYLQFESLIKEENDYGIKRTQQDIG